MRHLALALLAVGACLTSHASATTCAYTESRITVDSDVSASALAGTVNCSGGYFEVEWLGNYSSPSTISVTNGTVLFIEGEGVSASSIGGEYGEYGRLFFVSGATLHLVNLTVHTSHTRGDGGAVYARNSFVSVESCRLTNNNASSGSGGAVYVEHSSVELTGTTSFEDNFATSGGALYARFSNISISGDVEFARNHGKWGPSGYAGAAFLDRSYMVLSGNVSFERNDAWVGGAVHTMSDNSAINMTGTVTFRANEACFGGALSLRYSSVYVGGAVTFVDNRVDSNGGALNALSNGNVTIAGMASFLSNHALGNGGAVTLSSEGALTIEEGASVVFEANSANSSGGAVSACDESSISSYSNLTSFRHNLAGDSGGAIYARSLNVLYLHSDGERCLYVNNTAVDSGGAIYAIDVSSFYVVGAEFRRNNAGVGGAIVVHASYGSRQTSLDGQLAVEAAEIVSCLFSGNVASLAGGALNLGSGTMSVDNLIFTDNTAANSGGAIFTSAEITSFSRCHFHTNTASAGAAVANSGVIGSSDSLLFDGNNLVCVDEEFIDFTDPAANVTSSNYSSERYDVDCLGCASWTSCVNCTVASDSRVPSCCEVPDYTSSPSPTGTLETLTLDEGYWRAINTTTNILECYVESACAGGSVFGEYCATGYKGPYCAVCEDGYSTGLAYTCSKCSDTGGIIATTASGLFVAACAIVVLFILIDLIAVASGPHGVRGAVREFLARVKGAIRFHSLKIVVVAWQIIAQFSSVAGVAYPDVYDKFLDVVSVSNLDLTSLLAVDCLHTSSFYLGLFVSTLGPLAALALLLVTYNIAMVRNRGDPSVERRIWKKHANLALALMFLVYSQVSSTVFSMFACDDLDDGGSYLRADYSISCDTDQHRRLQKYAVFMIMVYPVGIPFVLGLVLVSHRHALLGRAGDRESDPKLKPFADLWQPYRPEMYLYEMVAYLRRIVLTGIVVFIYPNTAAQIAVTMVLEFFFFLLSAFLLPYGNKFDTRLSHVSHTAVFMSLYVALLFEVDISDETDQSQRAFAVVVVFIHCLMVASVIAEGALLAWHLKMETRSLRVGSSSRNVVEGDSEPAVEEEAAFPSRKRRSVDQLAS